MKYTIDDLEAALIDLVDGENEYNLKNQTGLSIERCKEIKKLFDAVMKNYNKRHNIS